MWTFEQDIPMLLPHGIPLHLSLECVDIFVGSLVLYSADEYGLTVMHVHFAAEIQED